MVRKYLSYRDDNDEGTIVKGFFDVLEETENWIKLKTTSGRILKIPHHRILKIKEEER